jgi:hypothetical protein
VRAAANSDRGVSRTAITSRIQMNSSAQEGGGELLVCPICFNSKKLDEAQFVDNARLAGATPLWQWIGEGAATVYSY